MKREVLVWMLLAFLLFGAISATAGSETDSTMIGEEGIHCGSREIADYGTSIPTYIVGTTDIFPHSIYSPYYNNFVHGVNIVFQLPSKSDVRITLGYLLAGYDENCRDDDIKVFMNDEFVGYWDPYDGAVIYEAGLLSFEIPSKYTESGENNLLLTMEHLPKNVVAYYGFAGIILEAGDSKYQIGMEVPDFGPVSSSAYGTSVPTYTLGEPTNKFPRAIRSPGYKDRVHGVNLRFNLASESDVIIRINCWAWKDKNNREDDIQVFMNSEFVGCWDPYSGRQFYGNRTFSYEIPSEYTKEGMNELTLTMEHLPDIKYTWYNPYWIKLEAEQLKPTEIPEISEYYAPIIYQDIADDNPRADYITKFNYDGDWIGNNDWDNLENYKLLPYVYYSIVESDNHWFICYAFNHPQDTQLWHDFDLLKHENDMEGLMMVIEKDGTRYGRLCCMVTVAHYDFFSFVLPNSNIEGNEEDIDGEISFEGSHPRIYIQAKGHGVFGSPGNYYKGLMHIGNWEDEFPTGPLGGYGGIVYCPGDKAEEPSLETLQKENAQCVSYKLISIDQLWERRFDIGDGNTFGKYGAFDGDCGWMDFCREDAAHAPWAWDDTGAALAPDNVEAGVIFTDPIKLVSAYFKGVVTQEEKYINNPYRTQTRNVLEGIPAIPQNWKDWCAWASAQMVLNYYGYDVTQELIGKTTCEGTEYDWNHGLSLALTDEYIEAIKHLSHDSLEIEPLTTSDKGALLKQITEAIENKNPIIMISNGAWLVDIFDYIKHPMGAHASVIVGYSLLSKEGLVKELPGLGVSPPAIKLHDPAAADVGFGAYWLDYDTFFEKTTEGDSYLMLWVVKERAGAWKYQKEMTIKENSGETLTDYQVLVELKGDNFPSKAKPDGADIRFTDAEGQELSYWIEEYDYSGKHAKIWVKVPEVLANGDMKITIFYGNEKSESVSDGEKVFEFFDDFERNLDKFELIKTSSTSIIRRVSTKAYYGFYSVESYQKTDEGWTSTDTRLKYKFPNPRTGIYEVWFYDDITVSGIQVQNIGGPSDWFVIGINTRDCGSYYCTGDGWATWIKTDIPRSTGWHKFTFVVTGSNVKGYIDDKYAGETFTEKVMNEISVGNSCWTVSGSGLYQDLAIVRKYTSPEPTVIVGAEQSSPTSLPSPAVSADTSSLSTSVGENKDISFTVSNNGGDSDTEACLSVSVSSGLQMGELSSSSSDMRFKYSGVGSEIVNSEGKIITPEYELLDAYDAYSTGETNTVQKRVEVPWKMEGE